MEIKIKDRSVNNMLEETIDQQTAKQNRLKNDKRKNYFWN